MRRTFLLVLLCFITFSIDAQIRRRATTPRPAQEQSDVSKYAQPKEYVIASIEVEGLRVLDKNALISLTGLKVGDNIKIPGDKASNALRKLWKYGLIGDAGLRIDKIEGEMFFDRSRKTFKHTRN